VEESRSNLLIGSEDIENSTDWVRSNCGISTNITTAPNGTLTAEKIVDDNTINQRWVRRRVVGVATNTLITASVFFKFDSTNLSARGFSFVVTDAETGGSSYSSINIRTNGSITFTQDFPNTTGGLVALPNGWYRSHVTFTNGSISQLSVRLQPLLDSNGAAVYQGDGSSGVFVWGAQLETGAFPTSYIPTTTSTVTRTADNVSMVGENFSSWYNQSEGTVYADTRIVGVQTARFDRLWAITNSNLNQDGLGLFISGPSGTFGIYDITTTIGGVTQYPEAGGTLSTSGMGITASSTPRLKSCFGFTTGNTNISYNGRLPNSSGVTITNLLTADRLFIGQPQRFQGHSCMTISQLTYYPRRLTNAQLVTLTR
jgi:hypothetical protein